MDTGVESGNAYLRHTAREREACADFLAQLADYDTVPEEWRPILRKVAPLVRSRDKWQEILDARRKAKAECPWEVGQGTEPPEAA
jgi:hypothetical protein